MTNNKKCKSGKRRALALAKLGLAVAAIYVAPTLLQLDQAHASTRGGNLSPVKDPTAAAECSECHLAYPAYMLTSSSWANLINNLSDHFGEDASLDPQTQAQVLKYYSENAPVGLGPMRVTKTSMFTRHHNETSFGLKKKFQCERCHYISDPNSSWFGQ